MYVRYKSHSSLSILEVRNVQHFSLQVNTLKGDKEVEEAVICDGSLFIVSDYAHKMASAIRGEPIGNSFVDCADINGSLAYFSSADAAKKVLDDICRALEAGQTFFDLTQYGEDGKLRT